MKRGAYAAAAALAALASGVGAAHHRHGHNLLFAKRAYGTGDVCVPGCTTVWSTITGEPTLVSVPTTTAVLANTTTVHLVASPSRIEAPPPSPPPPAATNEVTVAPIPVPTPASHVCPTPGTYTFKATTMTVSKATTVCAATSTQVPSGTHTIGGVTTVVKTATTVTCPIASISTSGSVTTSIVVQTKYVCPSAGTYTIAPLTTTVTEETVVTYPTPTSYKSGIYIAPEQVVTVTETDFVYYCPFTSSGLPTTTPASAIASTTSLASTTSAQPPPPPPAVPTETESAETPASTEQTTDAAPPSVPTDKETAGTSIPTTEVTPVSKPAPVPSKNTGGDLGSSNDHFGITYTPYEASNGHCKTSDQVERDIAELKGAGFTTVRVYSTDCHTLENVGNACEKNGMDMIVGIFVKGSGCSANAPEIKEQLDELSSWKKWHLVKLLVVGNEAIMNGYCSPAELRGLITHVKSQCSAYSGPYTISETLNIWQRSDVASSICDVVDITGANIHPYFNSDVTAGSAGDFVAGQLEILSKICKGNEAINLECGWPTRGSCNGKACPGQKEQAEAIKSIREKTGSKTVFFSFQDDLWKDAGSCGCEQSWGTAASFRLDVSI